MIKLPTELVIGYTKFKIEDIRDTTNPRDDCAYGTTDKDAQVIQLYQNNTAEAEKPLADLNTVIHECFHAAHDIYGTGLSSDHEEKMVNLHANIMTEILVRNPDIVRFIQESLKKNKK